MDRHGILKITQQIGAALREQQKERKQRDPSWRWAKDMLICPEIPCFACNKVCKTNVAIVFNEATKKLVGQWTVEPAKLILGQPYHTHAHGVTGGICLGNAKSLLQLLYSPPRAHNMWSWDVKMIRWQHRYMQHDCLEMHKWWDAHFLGKDYPWDGPFIHKATKPPKFSEWETYGTPGNKIHPYLREGTLEEGE